MGDDCCLPSGGTAGSRLARRVSIAFVLCATFRCRSGALIAFALLVWEAATGSYCCMRKGPDCGVLTALFCWSAAAGDDRVAGGGETFGSGIKFAARTNLFPLEGSRTKY